MSKWQNKIALITGASAGIGKEIAIALHSQGADVFLVSRRQELLEALASQLNKKREKSAKIYCCDLSKQQELSALEDFIRSTQVDCLVNNAGFGSFGEFDKLSLNREIEMLAVNILAPVRLAHAVIPQMKTRGSGDIVVISSIAGYQPVPYMSTYSATKAFNLFHTLALREEIKPYGINVLCVCPGPVATEFAGVARVSFASGPRVEADIVALQTLTALERKQRVLFPHWSAKLTYFWIALLPKRLLMMITAKAMRRTLQVSQEVQK